MTSAATPDVLIALIVATVAAPLVAAAAVALGFSRSSPRTPAAVGLIVSLLASVAVGWHWNAGAGVAFEFGDRLGGGSFLHIDGIAATLLPMVALIEMAIVLVAPKRFLDPPATVRLLASASATFALFATAHPLLIVVLWVATALPTWISTRGTPGGRPTARVFATAMLAALGCMTVGTVLMVIDPPWEQGCGLVGNAGGWLVA
ncbi:MAG: hypothetical protein WCJ18_04380, partial [Planctomycetota bacterium]